MLRHTSTDVLSGVDPLAGLYCPARLDISTSLNAAPGTDVCLLRCWRCPNSDRERLLLREVQQALNRSPSLEASVLASNQTVHLRIARRRRTKGDQRADEAKQREDKKPNHSRVAPAGGVIRGRGGTRCHKDSHRRQQGGSDPRAVLSHIKSLWMRLKNALATTFSVRRNLTHRGTTWSARYGLLRPVNSDIRFTGWV